MVIEETIQLNITSPCVITILSTDSVGNTDSTEISIEFIAEDLLPPKFDHEFYYATIQNPEFSEQVLYIEPSAINAIDGDTAINEDIVYEIIQQTCKFCLNSLVSFIHFWIIYLGQDSFEIDENNAAITWIKQLDENCLKNDNLYITVEACQKNSEIKRCATTTLTVRILGNDYQPKFSRSLYHSQTLAVSVSKLPTSISAQ